ncbi:MAG: OxaA [uncultured bacterium]|nr:MAG: OxaA [uncultured bacterium]
MDKNLLKAIVLSFLVILLWETFFVPPPSKQVIKKSYDIKQKNQQEKSQVNTNATTIVTTPKEEKDITPETKLIENPSFPEKTESLKSAVTDIEISNVGGGIKSLLFKSYNETLNFDKIKKLPLALTRVGNYTGIENLPFNISRDENSNSININTTIQNNVDIVSSISPSEHDYLFRLKLIVRNKSAGDIYFKDGIELFCGNLELQENKQYPTLDYSRLNIEKKTENLSYKKVINSETIDEPFYWAGIQNSIYCSLIKEAELLTKVTYYREPTKNHISASVSTPDFSLSSNQEKIFYFNYYIGPKLYFHLEKLNLEFEKVINYGAIIGPITKLLVIFLNYLFNLTHNYGIAIILMTLVFKIVTYPLTKKAMVSMKNMQKLQPYVEQLKKQYKDDPMQMQKETMLLYKKHQVNPLQGCLPLLIQMPIFIAFYQAISNSVELQGAAFWIIKDLAAPDKILKIGDLGINVLPLLMGIVQLISSVQTTTDPNQKMLMYFFPVLMIVIFYNMPSALVLYFVVSTFIGIIQTWMIKIPSKKAEA